MRVYITSLFFIITFCSATYSQAYPVKEPPETRILFIFDASQSMAGYWESDKKITIARNLLIHIIDSLEQLENVSMALRLYGHQSPVPPQDCSDTKLEVPFAKGNAGRIRQELRFINPKGTTPIAESILKGGGDFPKECDNCRNIIILITDGIEACDGDPCEASRILQQKGVTLKPFVIGIGIDEHFKESFNCIGHYYNAANEEKFKEVLGLVITHALNSTTAQVNLLDSQGNPTETDVALTFYDQFSGKVKYNYMHTINHMGNPDTLILDHLITYRLVIHTIPEVEVRDIKVSVGTHSIIAARTPQGVLNIVSKGVNQYKDILCRVTKSGTDSVLNYQVTAKPEKYLIGKYDIEIPVLPRLKVESVEIKPNYTTTIEIPRPGLATILKTTTGYGAIFLIKDEGEEWIINLNPEVENESFVLQPGTYKAVYRAKNAKQAIYTITKTFDINSGSSKVINMY